MAKGIRFYETGGPEVLRWEALEVGDERPGSEPAAMDVRGHGAAHGQAVGAGLFLADAHLRPGAALQRQVAAYHVRPGDAGFDLEMRGAAIEPAHLVEPAHVEQQSAAEELLAAHGMARAGDGERFAARGRGSHQVRYFRDGSRFQDAGYRSAIQGRVGVVDPGRACEPANRSESRVHGVGNSRTHRQPAIPRFPVSVFDTTRPAHGAAICGRIRLAWGRPTE